MNPKCLILLAGITAALNGSAFGQQDEKLGKLSFPTSCDPKVQAEFERGVAMIHSYWFLIARRTFEGVLRQDPNCAMAHWGIALDLLGNSLATVPPRADAEAAWAALEKAREVGAQDAARARLDRGVERLLSGPRQKPSQCPARRLQQRDGAVDATLP